ncbi:MAG: DUF177 domain-containing protein [Candidatus Saccharibacteria bacterium]|nr:DUF177 domain-containing protein [Pseudorhodobacter sp.]
MIRPLPTLPFRVATIAGRSATHVKFAPDQAARALIAAELNLIDLPQLVFDGEIRPSGKRDLVLTCTLTALAIQPCSLTLQPVKTRLTEAVTRKFIADYKFSDDDDVEMPDDDTIEPLGEVIDAAAIAIEALSLALPLYPRAPGVELGAVQVAPPGAAPLHDADLKPFAGLAKLIDLSPKSGDKG